MPGLIADARARVAAALEPVPGLTVVPFPRAADQITAPTALLVAEHVEPPTVACPAYVVTVAVWLVSHLTEPGPADDVLDETADLVLDALRKASVPFQSAQRGVWNDRHPAWKITTEA